MTVPAVENFIKQIHLCGGEIKKNFVKKKERTLQGKIKRLGKAKRSRVYEVSM